MSDKPTDDPSYVVRKSDAEWRQQLDPMQYQVARQAATERAFTGKYWDRFQAGRYDCVGCGTPLFKSDSKFDAGCGWPSFDDEIPGAVKRTPDADGQRTAMACNRAAFIAGQAQQPLEIRKTACAIAQLPAPVVPLACRGCRELPAAAVGSRRAHALAVQVAERKSRGKRHARILAYKIPC